MGRLPLGDYSCGSHEAGDGLWRRKAAVRDALVVKPSRRKPFGLYDILGVSLLASEKEIHKAYRQQALKCHPDKADRTPHAQSAATKKFRLLQQAFDVLVDPELRQQYDKKHELKGRDRNSESSLRVAVHRSRLTKKEKRIAAAIDVGRKRMKAKKSAQQTKGKKIIARKGVTVRSRVIRQPDKWVVIKRPRKELKDDRRKKKFVAVPASLHRSD